MSDAREMGEMLACAPVGREEALVPVLCVEATARTQEAVEGALRAMAATATDGGAASCARAALCKLPGTRLRVSPHTTVHVLRGFLQSEVAGAADSVATAQFFAVRVPAAAGAAGGVARAAEVRVGGTDADADADAEESVVELNPDTMLQEVLSCGTALRLESADDELEPTLVLLYSRESRYGDMDGGDFLCIGLCAAMVACCIGLCVSSAVSSAKEKKQRKKYEQQQQEMQQHNQQQYNQNFNQQGGYQNNYNHQPYNQPYNQPYYQGPNTYGAPPQQQPVNGYPVAQPAYYNYSGDPALAQQQQPPPQQPQYYNQNPSTNPQQGYYQQGGANNTSCHGTANQNNGYPSANPL